MITVLILVGIALLLVLLVLFVPVRYKLYGEKQDKFICKIKASWLGFVFCFKAQYDEKGFVYKLKTFGGTLVSNQEGFEETEKEDDTEKAQKRHKKHKKKPTDNNVSSVTISENDGHKTDIQQDNDIENISSKQNNINDDNQENRDFAYDESEFKTVKQSIFTYIGKIYDRFILAIKNKIETFVSKVKLLKNKTAQYKKFICSSWTKQALTVLKINVIKLLKHLNPKKVKGKVTYGTGDPASTGQHLGYMSVALPLYYDKIDITPDFSQKIFEGDIFMKGRVRVCNILYYVCMVYFNKNVQKTIKHFKKISGGNK
jgi:hypothetical protein